MEKSVQTLTIVTRKSALALWQANFVKEALEKIHPGIQITVIGITTSGDKIVDESLSKIGGKGLFVKELEEVLLQNQADIAVHSMKDVPATLPDHLEIAAILKREDPRDVLLLKLPLSAHIPLKSDSDIIASNEVKAYYAPTLTSLNIKSKLKLLKPESIVGTSSLRREAQLHAMQSSLKTSFNVKTLRGNIDTRINKLESGEYDAIILAAAGVKRLGMTHKISGFFETKLMLPAIGQGALGIECRKDNDKIKKLIQALNHPKTAFCVMAERKMNALLGGSCQLPVAGLAEFELDKFFQLQGLVASPNGYSMIKAKAFRKGLNELNALEMGQEVAEKLLALGAQKIIDQIK